jgi:site-specific DNA-methyltransferase (adenine-specific)
MTESIPVEELDEPFCTFGKDGQEISALSDWKPDKAKIRGSMVKWIREVDEVEVDEFSAEACMHRWYEWMRGKVNRFYRILKRNGKDWDRYQRLSYQEMAEQMRLLRDNNNEFADLLEQKVHVKKEDDTGESDNIGDSGTGDDVGTDDSGGNSDKNDEDDAEVERDFSGPFAELQEIGILTHDKKVDKDTIRGTMVKFAKEVDAIEVDAMSPGYEGAKEAYNRWMMDKFGNTWVNFTINFLGPGELDEIAEAMYERHDTYSGLVQDKWEYKPGNSKEDGEKEEQEADDKPGNISGWAEKHGGSDDGSDNDVDDNEESGPSSHKSDNYRLKQWSEVEADKDEMFDLDEIRNTIIRENVFSAMDKIPTNSVDCVVTSPPYWNLRDYDGEDFSPIGGDVDCDHSFNNGRCYHCDAWKGQLGHEPEPQMFIDNIVAIMQKIRRILKPTGSLFLNIGDNYAGEDYRGDVQVTRKSMMAIPYRIYIKLMELGWVMRNPVIWIKRILLDDDDVIGAANPTSVSDRINHTYEPMWWFTNEPDYYSDIFAVRREHKTEAQDMSGYEGKYDEEEYDDEMYNSPTARAAREGYDPSFQHDAGANIPDAWRVPTGSAGKEHPAVFSPRLPMRPIKMACPKFVCGNCLTPYLREVEEGEHKGWEKQCRCGTDERENGIVFEPFCGRGTTCRSAEEEGRDWITTEVSDKYADFAEDYITGSKATDLSDFA